MASNQSQGQRGQYHHPTRGQPSQGRNQSQQQHQSQYRGSQTQHHQRVDRPQYAAPNPTGTAPVVTPPTAATSAATVRSQQDCLELLALEFSSLADREMPSQGFDAAASQQQQVAGPASAPAVPGHAIASGTPTNNLIARTIRAAMVEIGPSS
ncbi:hypothetical protein BBK36DRAFT_8229 [Trichoderma citrinoviride]|uniref:Uncharacterized protein n=1 Tax=Trichoderma citrinoviride TaxID=58853 RepID=A0A2T4AZZ9_9HYPO|nr:hypothetical protein BBK36DRAFT_8229 [Trichoderma citrinoviride]PTB62649.1 hypothetical protein BBK36DRAFT_8229 [Trichoderma citrinoviride]